MDEHRIGCATHTELGVLTPIFISPCVDDDEWLKWLEQCLYHRRGDSSIPECMLLLHCLRLIDLGGCSIGRKALSDPIPEIFTSPYLPCNWPFIRTRLEPIEKYAPGMIDRARNYHPRTHLLIDGYADMRSVVPLSTLF
jgi:hypothetical protein